jgi:hypothetical protein
MTAPAYRSHTVQQNTIASTSASVSIPAGVADGDVLLLFLSIDEALVESPTFPAGFTSLQTKDTSGGTADGQCLYVRYKIASGESGTYDVSWSINSLRNLFVVAAYSGAGSGVPLSSIASNSTPGASPVTATASAITTTSVDNLIVNFTMSDDNGAVSGIAPPATYTERYDGAGGANTSGEFSDVSQASIGSTGAVTSTITLSSGTACFIAAMVALEPAITTGNLAWITA